MNKKLITLIGITIMTAVSTHAAVTVYEGFTDYTSTLNNQNGGTGWSGAWAASPASGGAVTGSSDAIVATTNLASASDYVFNSGAVSGTDTDGSYIQDVQGGLARKFSSNAFDLSADATTYFSYNWLESGSGGAGNLFVTFSDETTHSGRVWQMSTASSILTVSNKNSAIGTVGFTNNTSYLLVGKVVSTTAGNDTVSISIFQNGTAIGSEPVTWNISGNLDAADANTSVGRLFLTGSGNNDQFDEFIIGDTFADVTAIPEPSTFALLMLGGAGLVLLRRKQK